MLRIRSLRHDSFVIAVVSMLGVLLLGMLSGLVLAVALSLMLVLTHIARPTVDVVSSPGDEVLALHPNTLLLFLNVRWVRTRVLSMVRTAQRRPGAVVLDLGMSANLDVESVDTLDELRTTLGEEGIELCLIGVRDDAKVALTRSGFFTKQPQSVPRA